MQTQVQHRQKNLRVFSTVPVRIAGLLEASFAVQLAILGAVPNTLVAVDWCRQACQT